MKNRVAILTRRKSDCIPLLNDLQQNGVREHDVFIRWEDIWLSEQKNKYDYILIDYYFFEVFRNNMTCYHLFHQYKFKITFFSNISHNVETEKGNKAVDLYRIFFQPFVDFNNLTNKDNNFPIAYKDTVMDMGLEKKSVLNYTDNFFLKDGYSLIKFHLSEILCLESDRNYINIYLSKENHLIRQTLQSTLEILPEQFYRINRSVIININKIDKIVGNKVYINGLTKFRPMISNKYKYAILNAVPLFN